MLGGTFGEKKGTEHDRRRRARLSEQEQKDEGRIKSIESDNMWEALIHKELLERIKHDDSASQSQPRSFDIPRHSSTGDLASALRGEELRQRIATDPDVRAQLRQLKARVDALNSGTAVESWDSYRFLNRNDLASNHHMINATRKPPPPPPPGKERIDYRECDKTSLWCASWQFASSH